MSRVETNSKCTLSLVLLVFSILIVGCQCQSCLQYTLPCIPRNPQVRAPGPGQYGIHSTRIRTNNGCASNAACCVMLSKYQDPDRTIDTMGDDPRLSHIFSPGFELEPPVPYGREIFVRYEIVCPDNNMIQYSVSTIDMEERIDMEGSVCFGQCVDYVRFLGDTQGGGNVGDVEFCGNTPSDNFLHPSNTLSVVFITDNANNFPGFKAQTLCLAVENTFTANTAPQGRKRREAFVMSDLEAFNNLWRRRLSHYIHRKRDNFSGRFKRLSFRFEEFIVRNGFSFNYINQQIIVREDSNTSMEDRAIYDVCWLHTFDDNGVVSHFRGSADPLSFRGAGPLTVLGEHVYFVHFLVDPRGILPETEEERRVFRLLANAHFDRVLEYPDEKLCYELLNSTIEDPSPSDPNCTLPLTTAPLSCTLTVQCNIISNTTEGPFTVSCESNRLTGGVRISECFINESILSNCTFPAFTFSGRTLNNGMHFLDLTFIDSIEFEDTDVVQFTVLRFD